MYKTPRKNREGTKEKTKKGRTKTKPPGMIRGELFTVFFLTYAAVVASVVSETLGAALSVGSLSFLPQEAKQRTAIRVASASAMYFFILCFLLMKTLSMCVFFFLRSRAPQPTDIAAGSRFQHGKS